MRIGICDDNSEARVIVRRWLVRRDDVLPQNIFDFTCGEAVLEFFRHATLDILILDCKMEGMDGIETARKIRLINSAIIIILLTDFDGYARFGYEVDIFGYILKRDFHEQAGKVIDKAVARIREADARTFTIKTGAGVHVLKVSDILFIEAHRRKKELRMINGQSLEFYGKIEDAENMLKKYGFIRPHNSYVVNSRYVRVFSTSSLRLAGYDAPIPVSRGRYRQAFDELTVFASESEI